MDEVMTCRCGCQNFIIHVACIQCSDCSMIYSFYKDMPAHLIYHHNYRITHCEFNEKTKVD